MLRWKSVPLCSSPIFQPSIISFYNIWFDLTIRPHKIGFPRWHSHLEKEMTTHSSLLAWEIPWTEELGTVHEVTRARHDCVAKPTCLGGAVIKNLPANAGDTRDAGLIPGLGRSPRVGNGIHSSILAWKIPWTEESGRLQSMGLQRVRHDWLSTHTHHIK